MPIDAVNPRAVILGVAAMLALHLVALGGPAAAPARTVTTLGEGFPYGSPAFARLVADSYETSGPDNVMGFDRWLARTYVRTPTAQLVRRPIGSHANELAHDLAARREQLRGSADAPKRANLEIDTAAWLHRAVKAMIPRFSLDRGFEFANTVRFGERQCLLQSTLIAALLQAADVEAGVAMVWKNPAGRESNNGHAVTMVRLADGRDLLVDASAREPFVRHQGLFVRDAQSRAYRFVRVRYGADGAIAGYRSENDGKRLEANAIRPLDMTFVRSQFYYYRGERAAGGVLGKPITPVGLAASARFLERAERLAPGNALAVYVLGHVYLKQGRQAAARAQYVRAYRLYRAAGYVPAGPRSAYVAAMWR